MSMEFLYFVLLVLLHFNTEENWIYHSSKLITEIDLKTLDQNFTKKKKIINRY